MSIEACRWQKMPGNDMRVSWASHMVSLWRGLC